MALIFGLFFIILTLFLVGLVYEYEAYSINKWVKKKGFELVDLDLSLFDYGPFYYKAHYHRIYKIVVKDSEANIKTFYCRSGFGFEYVEAIEK